MFDRIVAFTAQRSPHAIAVSSASGDRSYARLEGDVGRFAAALDRERRPALA